MAEQAHSLADCIAALCAADDKGVIMLSVETKADLLELLASMRRRGELTKNVGTQENHVGTHEK